MVAQTMQTGAFSELMTMAEYTKRGYSIFTPVMAERCDFLAEKFGRYARIQVKSGTPYNGDRELMAFSQKPYTKEDADIIVVLDIKTGDFYYIPVEHVEGQKQIRIRITPYVYNVQEEKALPGSFYKKFIG